MKKILSILLLTGIAYSSFGQADQNRFPKTPLTGANQNKTSIVDYNLKVMSNLYVPKKTSFNLNNGKDSSSALLYQDVIKRLGVYNGSSWDTLAFSKDFANYMKIADGLTRLDSIKVSGLTVTAYAPITWRINAINYQKLTNSVFSIPAATNGYNRIDLLYATTSNTVLRLQGTETTGIAVAPVLPANTISVALLYINGSVIQPPFPDLSNFITKPQGDSWYVDFLSNQTIDGQKFFNKPLMGQGYKMGNILSNVYPAVWLGDNDANAPTYFNYSFLKDTSTGSTYFNVPTGGELELRINNDGKLKVDNTGVTIKSLVGTAGSPDRTVGVDADGKLKIVSGGGGGAVSSVFGRTGAVTAQSGDYSSFYYPLSTNPAGYLTSVPAQSFASLTGKPTTLSGYGITDAYPLTGNPSGFLTSYTETDPLFDTKFSGKSTTNLTEGTNLYFNQARVSANTDVTANTAARHSAVTLGTSNGLSLVGQQLSLGLASSGVTGALSGTDWNLFNSKQGQLVLTTLGTSGTATLIGNTLNIPNYATGGGGGSSATRVPVTLASNATVIPITWSTYSATYGVSPTDLSLIELSATGDRQVFTNWYSDDNGVTYKFDVAPETGSRNFVVVISGGSTVTSGNVTSVTSANGDISVTNSTTTPVLTLNSGTGANQIVKRNGSGTIADLATGQSIGANTTGNAATSTLSGNSTLWNSQTFNGTYASGDIDGFMIRNLTSGFYQYAGKTTVSNILGVNNNSLLTNSITGNAGTASAVAWGNITGSITAQTDLLNSLSAKQNMLNGTGFVKASGATITYDNTSYYPASNPNGYISSSPSQVQNSLTPNSTTLAPSVTAVNGGLALKANDNQVVHLTGNETISGDKTFSNNVNSGQVGAGNFYLGSVSSYTGRFVDGGGYIALDSYNGTSFAKEVRLQGTNISLLPGTGSVSINRSAVSGYKLISNQGTDMNIGLGVQGSESSIESFNDAVNAATPLRIYSSKTQINPIAGNVLIGTTTDNGAKLQVTGKATVSSAPTNPTDVVRLSDLPTPYTLPTASASVLGGVKVGSGLAIDGSGVLSATSGTVISGTYSATASAVQNISAISVNGTMYSRVGNIVTYSGFVTVSNTANAQSIFTITLPVSSTFTANQDIAGVISSSGNVGSVSYSSGSPNVALISYSANGSSSNSSLWFTCQYVIK